MNLRPNLYMSEQVKRVNQSLLSLKLKVAILTDNKQPTCTTGMSLISDSANCWLRSRQYPVNTPLIVDESFVLLKRESRSIETISSEGKQVRLHTNLFFSFYTGLMLIVEWREKPAILYGVLFEAFSGSVPIRSSHFSDTMTVSSCFRHHVLLRQSDLSTFSCWLKNVCKKCPLTIVIPYK